MTPKQLNAAILQRLDGAGWLNTAAIADSIADVDERTVRSRLIVLATSGHLDKRQLSEGKREWTLRR